MLTAKGALPIILTIILVHSISYINPVRPDRKKHTRTSVSMLLPESCEGLLLLADLCGILLLAIQCPDCFDRRKVISQPSFNVQCRIIVFIRLSYEFFFTTGRETIPIFRRSDCWRSRANVCFSTTFLGASTTSGSRIVAVEGGKGISMCSGVQ